MLSLPRLAAPIFWEQSYSYAKHGVRIFGHHGFTNSVLGCLPDSSSRLSQLTVLFNAFQIWIETDFQSQHRSKSKRHRILELLIACIPALWQKAVCISEVSMQRETGKKEELVVPTLYSVALRHDYTFILLALGLIIENPVGSLLHHSLC